MYSSVSLLTALRIWISLPDDFEDERYIQRRHFAHKIVEYIPIGRPHLIICAFDVVESKQFLKFLEIIY